MNCYGLLERTDGSTNGCIALKSFDSSTEIRRIIIYPQDTVQFSTKNCLDLSPYSPMLASEKALSKTWLLPEEDEAWQNL